jgi:hypothetical protein
MNLKCRSLAVLGTTRRTFVSLGTTRRTFVSLGMTPQELHD